MRYYCTWRKLSCKSPISYVEVQAVFGTVITCSPSSGKARVGTAGRQLRLLTGVVLGFTCFEFCWACLKKATQNKAFEGMTFHSRGTGTRNWNRSQVRVPRLSGRSLNNLRDNKIRGVDSNSSVYQPHLFQYLLSHQHDAPQCLRGSLQR